jgi:hypothetical protein
MGRPGSASPRELGTSGAAPHGEPQDPGTSGSPRTTRLDQARNEEQRRRRAEEDRAKLEPDHARAGSCQGREHGERCKQPRRRPINPNGDVRFGPPNAVATTMTPAIPHIVNASASHSWVSTRRLSAVIGAKPATTCAVGIA